MIKKVGNKSIEILSPVIVLLVLTGLGVILDFAYREKINCKICVWLLTITKQCLTSFGLSHDELWGFIISNTGVLITCVTIFFTFTIEIFERSEKKIFGMSQKELFNISTKGWYRMLHKMVVMLPLFMLIYIILGFCAGSYLLLFWGYLFLVFIYSIHRRFYDEEKMTEKFCERLLEPFCEAVSINDVKDWNTYKNHLINIYDFTKKECDWIHAQELFFKFINTIQHLETEICFVAEYYFILIVFGQENKVHDFDFFKIVQNYLENMEYDENNNYKNQKDSILLWGMLLASIPYAAEKELIDFLRYFSDFTSRSCNKIRHMKQEIPNSICEKEAAMVLILLEEWLKKEASDEDEFGRLVGKLYREGEPVFMGRTLWNQDELIFLCERIPDYYRDIRKNVIDFKKEKYLKTTITRAACVVEAYEA